MIEAWIWFVVTKTPLITFLIWWFFVWVGRKLQLELEKTRLGRWFVKWIPAWTIGTVIALGAAYWWMGTWDWS